MHIYEAEQQRPPWPGKMAMMGGGEMHLRHVPALDGLRGVAVAAVVAFHAGHLTGGWLGVDVFFVLSGYLITRLLLVEADAHGRIDLKRFWGRRARRLLPAMLCAISVIALAERFRDRLAGPSGARWDVVGALSYTSNWVRLRGGAGYWSQFGPISLLEHFWSLAIEEQFYVVWPLIMIALTRLRRSTTTILLALATLAGAAWSLVLFNRTLDASRVYMGTDTRAYALLAGATVASLGEWRPLWLRPARLIAPIAAAGLVVAFARLDGTRLITYRGALVGCTMAAAILVSGVVGVGRGSGGASGGGQGSVGADGRGLQADGGRLGQLLSIPPLRWLGARSYGLYLWHWPVFVGLGVAGDENAALARIGLGIAVSLAIAEISYRFVEMPIRRRGRELFPWKPTLQLAGVAATVAALALVFIPIGQESPDGQGSAAAAELPTFAEDVPLFAPFTAEETGPDASGRTGSSGTAAGSKPAGEGSRPMRVLIVGDSVGWNLGEQMIADQATANVEVINLAIAGCPPSYQPLRRRRESGAVPQVFGEDCAERVRAYSEIVNMFQPDISFVVFGASLLEQNEIAPDVWSSPCEAPFDEWYRSLIEDISTGLGSADGRVVIVGQAYYRAEVTDRTPLYDDQIDCQNRIAESVTGSVHNAVYADLGTWTCPTRQCLIERDGIELRSDGTHFKGDAARKVNAWLLDHAASGYPDPAGHPDTSD